MGTEVHNSVITAYLTCFRNAFRKPRNLVLNDCGRTAPKSDKIARKRPKEIYY